MKLTATNLKYFAIIVAGVALAYAVNKFEGAISPLFMSMVLGLIVVNSVDGMKMVRKLRHLRRSAV